MKRIPADMVPGTVHETKKSGSLAIKEYRSSTEVDFYFINSGYESTAQASNIRSGSLKDPMIKSICGVGRIGDGPYRVQVDGVKTESYQVWAGMIKRCYCERVLKSRPTYRGCTVADEWHDFQTFSRWFYENYPKDGKKYDIDKDIKIDGNKVYSPDTCMFVSPRENTVKARAREYKFKSPEGSVFEVYNLAEFSREMGLDRCYMYNVHSGGRPSYKGWTKA